MPERMIITQQEYHTTTWEMIMPLDDDMILHCAPASAGAIVTDLAEAFIVPKNTLIKMNAAIWHLAPLPANNDKLTALIILPECTYANDCTVVNLKEDEQFEIIK
jgi:ureidoglycolate lyase